MNRVLGLTGVAVASLMMTGCENDAESDSSGDPNGEVSLILLVDPPAYSTEDLGKAEPQFKTDKFSATVVPLGESERDGKKVTKFALSADLPSNCTTPEGNIAPANGSGACVNFMYAAHTGFLDRKAADYRSSLYEGSGEAFLKSTKGVSTFELVSPLESSLTAVSIIADGENVMIDVATGEIVEIPKEATVTMSPVEKPSSNP